MYFVLDLVPSLSAGLGTICLCSEPSLQAAGGSSGVGTSEVKLRRCLHLEVLDDQRLYV